MNPLYIIGGLVYVTIGIWFFDYYGKEKGFKDMKSMLASFILAVLFWLVIVIDAVITLLPKLKFKVPERYRVRKKK